MPNRRTAEYVRTLVYADGPQLILLRSHKTNIVGLALPSDNNQLRFIATSVTKLHWEQYLDGVVDLRYLFTHADVRSTYSFDLMRLNNNRIMMDPWQGPVTEAELPGARFFSSNHTEDDPDEVDIDPDSETLLVDGEWDMPDFGQFYNKFSDVYYFLASANEYEDSDTPKALRNSIANAFKDKAFQGGFSYVHFYGALAGNRDRAQRLGIDAIKWESPGYINMQVERASFDETRSAINHFMTNRKQSQQSYNELYKFLSKSGLLQLSGDQYQFQPNHPSDKFIREKTVRLAEILDVPNVETIMSLVDNNSLVLAKIILSFYRRLEDASKFFAQGRMNFA